MSEELSRSCRIATALGLCLAAAGMPALGAEHTFDGIYTGKRSLTKGTAGPNCPAEEDVSVTIHGETLKFTDGALKSSHCPSIPVRMDRSVRLIRVREEPPCIIA